jgi:NADPH-dependent 2,4-dienoyl-CoA reductase/sulfur reductase-like enzyme
VTTEETNLRTGKTLWRSLGLPRIPSEPLVRDRKADVVVIGAGITGAMAAQALSSQGLSVVLLERRDGPLLHKFTRR